MVVHPGAGNFTGTLINAIAWYLKDLEDLMQMTLKLDLFIELIRIQVDLLL